MLEKFTPFIILLITSAGFAYFIRVAQKGKTSRVDQFFVAGRNIGAPLFTQTTWGTSFAFGNSIFYGVWLGYSIGLSAFWLQALWALGMLAYALLLPRLIKFTEDHTLHGFLGSIYGRWTRIVASIVSVVGFLICLGFEVSFAAQYFAQVTNLQNVKWLVVVLSAVFIATFCSIGGFKANTLTDRLSNRIAVVALGGLVGAMVYQRWDAIAPGFSVSNLGASLTDFSGASWIYLASIACFSLFNIVDMSNWQNVSANSLSPDSSSASNEQRKRMQGAMLKAAGLFLIAPVILGTFLGYMLRVLKAGTNDQSIFMSKLVLDLLPLDSLLAVTGLAFITFAFMASSLSGSDSWLLASSQTLSWDLIDYRQFREKGFKISSLDQGTQERVTRRARWILMILGVGGASFVYYIWEHVWKDVFSLQFVIFGGGLAMLPSLLYGIAVNGLPQSRIVSLAALLSIIGGYGASLALFGYSLLKKDPTMVEPVPLLALGSALIIFLLGFGAQWLTKVWAKISHRRRHTT